MLTSAEWEELRTLARGNVQADRRRRDPAICLGPIDAAALRAADGWLGPERVADWDWRGVTKRPRDARFEVAIWNGERLCGLALGPVDGVLGMGRACLEYIEGASGAHPLRGEIIPIALITIEELARIMDLPEVRLLGPVPALVPLYETFGYQTVANRPGIRYLRRWMVQP